MLGRGVKGDLWPSAATTGSSIGQHVIGQDLEAQGSDNRGFGALGGGQVGHAPTILVVHTYSRAGSILQGAVGGSIIIQPLRSHSLGFKKILP